jgi:hypothetical protein
MTARMYKHPFGEALGTRIVSPEEGAWGRADGDHLTPWNSLTQGPRGRLGLKTGKR